MSTTQMSMTREAPLVIGYAFWGHLADYKFKHGQLASTPDGNATYSWAIIHALLKRGHRVYLMQEDRDYAFVRMMGASAFSAFCKRERASTYATAQRCPHSLPRLDILLNEWRMPTPGRNTKDDVHLPEFEPDLLRQNQLLEYYKGKCQLVAFDLDYVMTPDDDALFDDVLELGTKRGLRHQVGVPTTEEALTSRYQYCQRGPVVTYIGNRYDRDESIDDYLVPLAEMGVKVNLYGNWLERGRDSERRWPLLNFHNRLQLGDFPEVLSGTAVVPLLLKEEYYKHSFMTARLIETIMFNCLPALPTKFSHWGSDQQWVPEELMFTTAWDLRRIVKKSMDSRWRAFMIDSIRHNLLARCDANLFVNRLLGRTNTRA